MSEEFEGEVPNISILKIGRGGFTYQCADTEKTLRYSCSKGSPLHEKCFNCIGFNNRFGKYFEDNRRCSCGYKVDFGYFLLIFHFDKAELLPEDFRMMCCHCNNKKELPTCGRCEIDG